METPIYTPDTCPDVAYQLDWSYSVFWRTRPPDFAWLEELKELNEPDGIRILQHSTLPKPFRRNYSVRSIGSTRREKLEQYLAGQLSHHPMADPRVQQRLAEYQIERPEVDLSQPRQTSHAVYWYNLHIVIVHEERYREIRDDVLAGMRDMICRAADGKGHWLSRAAIVPDHIHLTLGCHLEESPEQVALGYMNNLAYACGMKPVFRFSYYVGGFSEYDLGVIPR